MEEGHPQLLFEVRLQRRRHADGVFLDEVGDELRFGNVGQVEELEETVDGINAKRGAGLVVNGQAVIVEIELPRVPAEHGEAAVVQLRRQPVHLHTVVFGTRQRRR